jgi:predicted transcriptional regulator
MKYTELLKAHIKASKETWDTFSEKAGVSRSTLYKVIRGKQSPRLAVLEKMLGAAGYKVVVVKKATPATPRGGEDAA